MFQPIIQAIESGRDRHGPLRANKSGLIKRYKSWCGCKCAAPINFNLTLRASSGNQAETSWLRVTTSASASRAIDLSLRNRWKCFWSASKTTRRRHARTISAGGGWEQQVSIWAGGVGMLFLLLYYPRGQGVGVRSAPLCSLDIACPVMTTFHACLRRAVHDLHPRMAPGAKPTP